MRAVILNNQGMQLEAQEQLEDAASAFSAAVELAERLRLRTVHAKALVNLLAITARAPALGSFESLWPRALSSARAARVGFAFAGVRPSGLDWRVGGAFKAWFGTAGAPSMR